ncbi:tail fiber assembly protein [Pseudomonas koreensis]|uniref:Tail fiber assembly protein n=1 Tax=Pseudomonas koreensis TaxID=198620 RepID=A0A9X2XKV1_9PSED|nr:tail fiber assembly protein [Pseudomonas koreensis]MCU7250762.1 tail fiber assembly protein [Pseudomonas koreensis]
MFASESTRGFYHPAIHDVMPSDVVEISPELHAELIADQSNGKLIEWGDDGYPKAIDPPRSEEDQIAVERVWRNQQLSQTDGLVARHRDEQESGIQTSLTSTQYTELQIYRRELRSWPEAKEFPLADHRPGTPSWLQIH